MLDLIRSERVAPLATLALVAVLLVAALAAGRDPIMDEAMVTANLLSEGLDRLFTPMALYEQATPLAHRLLGGLIARGADALGGIYAALMALRAFSALAALVVAFCVFRTVRLFGSRLEAAAAALIVTASPFAIEYGTQIKHYVFEAAASAAVLYAAARAAADGGRPRSLVWFVATAAIGYAFSFTLLLATAAASAGLVISLAVRDADLAAALRRPGPATPSAVARFAWSQRLAAAACLAALAIGLVMHLAYTRQVVVYQLAAYSDLYANAGGLKALAQGPKLLVQLLFAVTSPMWGARIFGSTPLTLGFGLLLAAALALSARRSAFIVASAAALALILLAARAAGVFPFIYWRHLYFATPFVAAMLVIGASEGVELAGGLVRARRGLATALLGAAVVIAFAVAGAGMTRRLHGEELSPLLRQAAAVAPQTPLWVYWGAQPAEALLARPGTVELGRLDNRSHKVSWFAGARDASHLAPQPYLDAAAGALRDRPDAWLVFSHYAPGDPERVVAAIDPTSERCRLQAKASQALLFRCAVSTKGPGRGGAGVRTAAEGG